MTDEQEGGLPLEPEVAHVENPVIRPKDDDDEDSVESEEKREREASKEAKRNLLNIPAPSNGPAPYWALVPEGMVYPRGKQVMFIRFRSEWTDAPWKGQELIGPDGVSLGLYRQCIIWSINTSDKKLAFARSNKDPNRAVDELAKQMIRVHDGIRTDWSVSSAQGIDGFWNELGEKCRGLMTRMFSRLHVLESAAVTDFLDNCVEVRKTGS